MLLLSDHVTNYIRSENNNLLRSKGKLNNNSKNGIRIDSRRQFCFLFGCMILEVDLRCAIWRAVFSLQEASILNVKWDIWAALSVCVRTCIIFSWKQNFANVFIEVRYRFVLTSLDIDVILILFVVVVVEVIVIVVNCTVNYYMTYYGWPWSLIWRTRHLSNNYENISTSHLF